MFDLRVLHIRLRVCFELNVACVPGATDANAYFSAHSLQCFSELSFLFVSYIYLLKGLGCSGLSVNTNKKRKRE